MTQIEVRDLNGHHLGKTIALALWGQVPASGVLSGVEHRADIIDDRQMGGGTTYAVGRASSKLYFTNGSIVYVEPAAEVELLD